MKTAQQLLDQIKALRLELLEQRGALMDVEIANGLPETDRAYIRKVRREVDKLHASCGRLVNTVQGRPKRWW